MSRPTQGPVDRFPYGAVTRYGPPFQTLPVPTQQATGLVRFRSPLLAESRLMSFPPATEMFQFAGFASRTYEFSPGYPIARVGCPIRRSRDQRSLASPPGFSQRATSFIASQCQGIHQMPLILARSTDAPAHSHRPIKLAPDRPPTPAGHPGTPPRTGASPNPDTLTGSPASMPRSQPDPARGQSPSPCHIRMCHIRMKTLSDRLTPGFRRERACARRPTRGQGGPPRSLVHKSALPFNQHRSRSPPDPCGITPLSPARRGTRPLFSECQSHRPIPARSRSPTPQARPTRPMEVNGIEPMTSCLQSRRSPN